MRALVHDNLSQTSVRQVRILLPILSNYAIYRTHGRALHGLDGVYSAPGRRLTDLDHADDITELAPILGGFTANEVAALVGSPSNVGKTKLFSSCIPDQVASLTINGCQLEEEEVDGLRYLVVGPRPSGQRKSDTASLTAAARRVHSILRKHPWTRRDISIVKVSMYPTSVQIVFLYG
nr:unnamed protein product [Spirometra erinaceieuropaei]